MTVPDISVRNLQRKIWVDVVELETFARNALKRCLQLQKRKRTDLRKVKGIAVWLISDRRMSRLHLRFLGESGPTDVITFHDGEIFISVETARRNSREFGNFLMSEIKLTISTRTVCRRYGPCSTGNVCTSTTPRPISLPRQ